MEGGGGGAGIRGGGPLDPGTGNDMLCFSSGRLRPVNTFMFDKSFG